MIGDIRSEIITHAQNGTLLDAIFNQYGKHWFEEDDSTIVALAELHNENIIDLLGIITPDSTKPYTGPAFFRGQHVYCALIPRLNTPARQLLTAVQTLVEGAGRDGAAGLPINEFAKWCSLDAGRPAELLALIDSNFPNADRFLPVTIKNGISVDRTYFLNRAYGFLTSESEREKQGAANALGQVALLGDDDWTRWLAAFTDLLAQEQTDLTNAAVLSAVAHRLNGVPSHHKDALVALGIAVVQSRGDQTLYTAAQTVALDLEHLPDSLLDALFESLVHVRAEHLGTINMLDLGLMKLAERGQFQRARQLLERLIRRDEEPLDPEKFDSFWHKLREIDGTVANEWVVNWLLDGDYRLCKALDSAFFGVRADEQAFNVDFTRSNLRREDFSYVARKAIGAFFLKTRLMVSILVSLLRVAPADQRDIIVELLVDPVLLNYSGVGSEYLEPIATDLADPAQSHVARALQSRDTYLQGLQAIGRVPELHPSERERTLEWQRHSDSLAEAHREARRESILALIATESVLLYGTRSVSWIDRPSAEPARIETPLASFSQSFEIPRIDIVDPLGLQLMLMSFRGEKRPA